MQSRLGSLTESLTNVLIGYWVAIGAQCLIFPAFGYHMPLRDNLLIGLWFTVVSIARSYCLRRLFNRLGIFQKH